MLKRLYNWVSNFLPIKRKMKAIKELMDYSLINRYFTSIELKETECAIYADGLFYLSGVKFRYCLKTGQLRFYSEYHSYDLYVSDSFDELTVGNFNYDDTEEFVQTFLLKFHHCIPLVVLKRMSKLDDTKSFILIVKETGNVYIADKRICNYPDLLVTVYDTELSSRTVVLEKEIPEVKEYIYANDIFMVDVSKLNSHDFLLMAKIVKRFNTADELFECFRRYVKLIRDVDVPFDKISSNDIGFHEMCTFLQKGFYPFMTSYGHALEFYDNRDKLTESSILTIYDLIKIIIREIDFNKCHDLKTFILQMRERVNGSKQLRDIYTKSFSYDSLVIPNDYKTIKMAEIPFDYPTIHEEGEYYLIYNVDDVLLEERYRWIMEMWLKDVLKTHKQKHIYFRKSSGILIETIEQKDGVYIRTVETVKTTPKLKQVKEKSKTRKNKQNKKGN